MTTQGFDLLGDPLPEPLPENIRLKNEDELVGHTIAAMIVNPAGHWRSACVIITVTRCFLVLDVEGDTCGGDDLGITVPHVYEREERLTLADFCSAEDLRHACILRPGEYEAMRAVEEAREAQVKAAKAARLRAEADKLAPLNTIEAEKP